jgi:hypothetical protein
VEVQFHSFLTLTLNGGEGSVSHPGRLTPREKASPPIEKVGVSYSWSEACLYRDSELKDLHALFYFL